MYHRECSLLFRHSVHNNPKSYVGSVITPAFHIKGLNSAPKDM